MDNNGVIKNKRTIRTGIIFGVVYGLVAAGFYITPLAFFLLGLASLSTAIILQNILVKNFGWLFLCLGALLAMVTVIIYLRRKNVEKLTLTEIKPYRAFIGGLTFALLITYTIIATLALFTFI
ncbi:hypothetical protein COS61_01970 [Candidatus Wolfebacteria bacterium CG03_land_8_20_14_0_80_40_12]|uniref:Uncharacterized protein n=1 Tax=Candidatus Wolfebacteria bacterium CG03_land_8_20_14_0_80_40_12 TaxID=1975069 RepID=A0A2M7B5E0_9BACT|nr:MAG: hypothetical protein COS61_01970 [Candidatus Wolfebacteria bacterium CG03_land_8_20_14_0_80_40_12]